MKTTILLTLSFLLFIPLAPIEAQSSDLNNAITDVIKAFDAEDTAKLNQYIHSDKGFTVLFRRGILDQYRTVTEIDFHHPVPEYLPYTPFTVDLNIRREALPTFNCDTETWSKIGLYLDTTTTDHLLSNTATKFNQYGEANIPPTTIDTFKALEANSHRIVLVDDKGRELIFYLTLIDDKWYLIILDQVTTDCSA